MKLLSGSHQRGYQPRIYSRPSSLSSTTRDKLFIHARYCLRNCSYLCRRDAGIKAFIDLAKFIIFTKLHLALHSLKKKKTHVVRLNETVFQTPRTTSILPVVIPPGEDFTLVADIPRIFEAEESLLHCGREIIEGRYRGLRVSLFRRAMHGVQHSGAT